MKVWIRDPKTSKSSVTLTLLVIAFFVSIIKLLLSGMTIQGISLGEFSGTDFATVVGSIGALYGFRKHTDLSGEEEESV